MRPLKRKLYGWKIFYDFSKMAQKCRFFDRNSEISKKFQNFFCSKIKASIDISKVIKKFFGPPTVLAAGPKNDFCLFREVKRRSPQFLAPGGGAEVKKILVINFGLVGGPNEPLVDQIRDFAGFDLFQMSQRLTVKNMLKNNMMLDVN